MESRTFAIEVVKTLQAAGHEALWAGGCVRDQLLGRTPKDYDVATSAEPGEVRNVFGKRWTLPIGASFGVITVLGPKGSGVDPIEVATFRRDGGYSDGRRPDAVEFTDAREDALRRDFTINGMFFDPIESKVIDYVGGKEDLKAKVVRAIGDPKARIEEDKLRMLRAIRFASTFDFELESATLAAVQQNATQIGAVSGERIGAEMRRMLAGPNRAVAVELLRESKLLEEILPSGESLYADSKKWNAMLAAIRQLSELDFSAATAITLQAIIEKLGVGEVVDRWKLSNDEKKSIGWISKNWKTLAVGHQKRWSEIQPVLLHQDASRALAVVDAFARSSTPEDTQALEAISFCRQRLAWSTDQLNPQPLLDGGDLIDLGIERGPKFKQILDAVRSAQLDGEIETVARAKEMALELASGV